MSGCISRFGTALAHELVSLEPLEDRRWEVYFGPILLGVLDEDRRQRDLIRPKPKRTRIEKVETMSPV